MIDYLEVSENFEKLITIKTGLHRSFAD